jgi:uncharacterized phage protein (TIGR01671 family)
MREICFRGMNKDNEFVYGSLVISGINGNWVIFEPCGKSYKVKPETVGQYTGLKTEDGKEIYEGDIVRQRRFLGWNKQDEEKYKDIYGVVRFENGMFTCGIVDGTLIDWDKCEVIGNIHENPELLEEVRKDD